MIAVENSEIETLFAVQSGKGLRHFVSAATPRAREMVLHGEIIRRKHNDGNVNCSPEATAHGAINALDDMLSPRPLFGNRIRWAIRTWNDFFGKK